MIKVLASKLENRGSVISLTAHLLYNLEFMN